MKKDVFSTEKLNKMLADCSGFSGAKCYETLSSTNDLAEQGEKEGTLILADMQTAGRGRMGRQFFSPEKTGLYMSLILRPGAGQQNAGVLTACGAVSVYRAILELTGVPVEIKWVNDLYYSGRKLCGILAEGHFASKGELDYVVLGIGVNLSSPKGGFTGELSEIATALSELPAENLPDRLTLCAAIVRHWFSIYSNLPDVSFLEDYRRQSCVIGRQVSYLQNGVPCVADAIGIDEEARLIVKAQEGETHILASGEITTMRTIL